MTRTAAVLCLIALVPTVTHAQTAVELNKKGYAGYEKREFREALALFKQSFTKDGRYYFAHYNYACTAALLLEEDWCGNSSLLPSLFEHLAKAVELNPAYRKKMVTDRDLRSVRATWRFLLISGLDPAKPADLEKMLIAITWNGPRTDVFPPSPVLRFSSGGLFEIGDFLIVGEGVPGYVTRRGTWRVLRADRARGAGIELVIGNAGGKTETITAVLMDGALSFPDGRFPSLTEERCPAGK